jgi:hypothetical protein
LSSQVVGAMWLIPYEIIIVISKQKASINYGLARAFSRQLDKSYYYDLLLFSGEADW